MMDPECSSKVDLPEVKMGESPKYQVMAIGTVTLGYQYSICIAC